MRTISRTSQFRRDYKRESKGRHRTTLDDGLAGVVPLLARDEKLPERFHDHALTGDWKGCRDCHLRPDLVLIYRLPDAERLDLLRLGSHSELGL